MHAYGGANLIPMAVPEICGLQSPLNSKYLFLSTNSAILTRSLVRMGFPSRLSKAFFKASSPSS